MFWWIFILVCYEERLNQFHREEKGRNVEYDFLFPLGLFLRYVNYGKRSWLSLWERQCCVVAETRKKAICCTNSGLLLLLFCNLSVTRNNSNSNSGSNSNSSGDTKWIVARRRRRRWKIFFIICAFGSHPRFPVTQSVVPLFFFSYILQKPAPLAPGASRGSPPSPFRFTKRAEAGWESEVCALAPIFVRSFRILPSGATDSALIKIAILLFAKMILRHLATAPLPENTWKDCNFSL